MCVRACACVCVCKDYHHIHTLPFANATILPIPLYEPMRTFDLDSLDHKDEKKNTTWADLLITEESENPKGEYIPSRIIQHRWDGHNNFEYKVLWYGYGQEMDTWEKEKHIEHTNAYKKYLGTQKNPKKTSEKQKQKTKQTAPIESNGPHDQTCEGHQDHKEQTENIDEARRIRLEIMRRKKSYGLHRGTEDRWYSVLSGQFPSGGGWHDQAVGRHSTTRCSLN